MPYIISPYGLIIALIYSIYIFGWISNNSGPHAESPTPTPTTSPNPYYNIWEITPESERKE